jgi:hypothetical protein
VDGAVYARIEPDRMFTFYLDPGSAGPGTT